MLMLLLRANANGKKTESERVIHFLNRMQVEVDVEECKNCFGFVSKSFMGSSVLFLFLTEKKK